MTFTSDLWRDLNRVLGIQVNYVPRYHQSTNGAIERQHRTLKESLKASLIEMGNQHRDKWMLQLPFTLLGRRVALQPDLQASSADFVLGASPVLPGVIFDDKVGQDDPHALLQTLQHNADRPAVPMSRHCQPDQPYMPEETENATHVYIEVGHPENLGMKFMGPFLIVDRPSPTTITVKVGITKRGLPRLETHHWSRAHVAHLRPDAILAERTDLGRRPQVAPDHRDRQQQIAPKTTKPPFATYDTEITQPRFRRGRTESTATPASVGGEDMLPEFESLNSLPLSPTGPPPVSPFSTNFSRQQQKQTLPLLEPETTLPWSADARASTPDPEPGTLPWPANARASTPGQEPDTPPWSANARAPSQPGTTSNPQPVSHLHDHDYFRRPTATLDHDYFRPLPDPVVQPPPGFTSPVTGRPKRQSKLPVKYSDYDLN